MDLDLFDCIFFTDVDSLLYGDLSFLENTDLLAGKIYILSSVVEKFNAAFASTPSEDKTDINGRIAIINGLLKEKKMTILSDGKKIADVGSVNLLKFLISRYYLKNIMIICNDGNEVTNYLPFIPIYEAFGKMFTITALRDSFEPFDYDKYDEAVSHLVKKNGDNVENSIPETANQASVNAGDTISSGSDGISEKSSKKLHKSLFKRGKN